MFILATVPRASGKTKRGGTEIEGQRGAFRERLFRQKFSIHFCPSTTPDRAGVCLKIQWERDCSSNGF